MSVESARKFVERVASDAEFRAQVDGAADPVAKKKLVQAAGYDFDMADIAAVLPQSAGGELSEKDLEGVAGGLSGSDATSIAMASLFGGTFVVSVASASAAAI